jgi:outer membrane receptor protein involved in Fe transport
MKLVRSSLLILATLLVAALSAQGGTTGKIAGTITDQRTGEALPGANVMVSVVWTDGRPSPFRSTLGASADIEGRFYILNVPPGIYTIQVSLVGYQRAEMQKVRVQVDRTTPLDVAMNSSAVEVSEVVIAAERYTVVKDQTSASAKVGSDELKALPVDNFASVMALQAGVTTDAGGGLHIRGGRSSEIQYYVDGIAVANPFDNALAIPVENNAIQELEVISGTFNAEYGEALSGIVNIVTREGGERYSASVSGFAGDFLTENPAFLGLDKHQVRQKSLEASFGGPLTSDLSFFGSGRWTDNVNQYYGVRRFNPFDSSYISGADPSLWHVENTGSGELVAMAPSRSLSYYGKLTWKITPTLKASIFSLGNTSHSRSYNHSQRYNPEYSPTDYVTSGAHNLKIDHSISSSTFYTLHLSFYTERLQRYVYENPFDARYAALFGRGNVPSDVFATGGLDGTHALRRSYTGAMRFDISHQLNYTHLLKAGAEFRYNDMYNDSYALYVDPNRYGDWVPHIPPLTSVDHDSYRRFPYQFAFYLQDKIEISDLIVNIGLRYDYFHSQGEVPTDFADPGNNVYPRPRSEAYRKVGAKQQLSPRVGLAFPITDRGVLHASYGQFFQIPPLASLFSNPDFKTVSGQFQTYIGNADLEPQRSAMYELGLQQQLTNTLFADVTAFYRDVRHLLGTQLYETYVRGNDYGRAFNADYGGVTGITLALDLRPMAETLLSGSFNYTYQVAEGNGSDPLQAFLDRQRGDESTRWLVPLAWDIRHNIAATMTLSDNIWGASVIASFKTGYPFSPDDFPELRNQDRRLSEYNVNLQAFRNFTVGDLTFQVFLRVENLFDTYTNESIPSIDPRDDLAFVSNRLDRMNTLYEYRDNPANYPTPRLVKIGFRIDY